VSAPEEAAVVCVCVCETVAEACIENNSDHFQKLIGLYLFVTIVHTAMKFFLQFFLYVV
jgi:hypothetical protein